MMQDLFERDYRQKVMDSFPDYEFSDEIIQEASGRGLTMEQFYDIYIYLPF